MRRAVIGSRGRVPPARIIENDAVNLSVEELDVRFEISVAAIDPDAQIDWESDDGDVDMSGPVTDRLNELLAELPKEGSWTRIRRSVKVFFGLAGDSEGGPSGRDDGS